MSKSNAVRGMTVGKYFSPFYDFGRRKLGLSPATIDHYLNLHGTATIEAKTITLKAGDDVLYAALLVKTDSGTNHVDCATSTPFAVASCSQNTGATGGGGLPRAFYGSGTSLTAMPATETISAVTASRLLMYAALD